MAAADYPVLDSLGNVIIPAGRGEGPSNSRIAETATLPTAIPGVTQLSSDGDVLIVTFGDGTTGEATLT